MYDYDLICIGCGPAGEKAAARRARVLGCEGKMVIHPDQVQLANELFKPSAEETAQARRILEAMAQAEAAGAGAVALDGKMLDIASIRHAQATVYKSELAETKNGSTGVNPSQQPDAEDHR